MRFLYTILPLLSAVALAQDLLPDDCNCPHVKCKTDDPLTLCQCINNRERACKKICPKYEPSFVPCTPPKPTSPPKPTLMPPTCECEPTYCLQVWPQSCYCANAAKERCYEKCGGPKPELQQCPPLEVESRAAEPEPEVVARAPEPDVIARAPEPTESETCVCEEVFCILSFPEGCYCRNNAERACEQKCGIKATIQDCGPPILPSSSFTTKVKQTKTPKPPKTRNPPTYPPPRPLPTDTSPPGNGKHEICGGMRPDANWCPEGQMCIDDPYTPGCGLACDRPGICVSEKRCGGIMGTPCPAEGMVCADDPRDDCDPKNGGADCLGVCVWPH